MGDLVLGIDVGTSSCKTLVVASEGSVLDSARYEYPVNSPRYGWAEQNPEDWFNAFQRGLKDILARHPDAAKRISAIGVTGQMIGLTILDKSGSVVRPAIIWMDQRCLPQVDRLKKDFKDLIWRRAFNPVNITYTLPKILWLEENEPDAWARLYKIQLPKDYVRLRLTGTWVMDHNDASGTLLLDVADLRWSDEIIDALGFDRGRLPELLPSMAVAGNLTPDAARLLGLTAGIPVVAGAGDLAAENLAAGVTSSRQLLTRMGTAGSSSTCIEAPQHDPFGISPCYPHCIPKRWIAEIADHTFGLCERWFRDTFFSLERTQAEQAGTDFYAMMDAMAEAGSPRLRRARVPPLQPRRTVLEPAAARRVLRHHAQPRQGAFLPVDAGRQHLLPEGFHPAIAGAHRTGPRGVPAGGRRHEEQALEPDDLRHPRDERPRAEDRGRLAGGRDDGRNRLGRLHRHRGRRSTAAS